MKQSLPQPQVFNTLILDPSINDYTSAGAAAAIHCSAAISAAGSRFHRSRATASLWVRILPRVVGDSQANVRVVN